LETALITMESVSKMYATERVETHALRDVALEIHDGEFVEVVGPSGCGKSTLLSLVGLLDSVTEGVYVLDGVRVDDLDNRERAFIRNRHVGFIFQAFNLISDLTVFENVELPLTYRAVPAQERRAAVEAILERVELEHRSDHYPAELSGGQQQRVAVARAVVGNPLIVLADEPTGNLDSASGDAVMQLLGELHADGTAAVPDPGSSSGVRPNRSAPAARPNRQVRIRRLPPAR
jgi:putative ABC transport system ATP-binding protein